MTDRLLTEAGDVLVTEDGNQFTQDAWVALSLYERRLLNTPSITKSLTNIYYGREEPYDITLEFDNADDYFTDLKIAGEEFRNRGVKLRRYEPLDTDPLTFEMYGVITSFNLVEDTEKKAVFTVAVKDPDPFQTPLPKKLMETSDFFADSPAPPSTPTHYHPAVDLGKAFSLCFGHCKRVPLRYISRDSVNNRADYLIGSGTIESNNSNKSTTVNVYRSKVLVGSTEYYVHGGEATIQYTDSAFGLTAGQANPYLGYAWIRFKGDGWEQTDFHGNLYELSMDVHGLKLGGDSTATRNFVRVIQYLLSNTTWGLGLTVDTASFDTAAVAALSTSPSILMSGIYCDGNISEQRIAQDIIDDLLYPCRGKLDQNETGAWTIGIDTYQQMVSVTFGDQDGEFENICKIDANGVTPTSEAIKEYTLSYRWNEWEQTYALSNKRTIFDFGEIQVIENPFIRNSDTADIVTSYIKQLMIVGDDKIDITVGMEGRGLRERSAIKVKTPKIDAIYQIRAIDRELTLFALKTIAYGPSIYDYVTGTIPPDDVADDRPDLSNTPPDAPTAFSIISWDRSVGNDGGTAIAVILRTTPPTVNFARIMFGWKKSTDTTWSYRDGEAPSAGICKGRIDGLVPGTEYDFTAVAVNAFGKQSVGNPTILNQNAGGDIGAPAAPTGLTATGVIRGIRLEWTPGTEADLAEYLIYRNTSNNSGTATKIFTSPAAKLRIAGDKLKFTDNTITSYTQYYYYWLKAVDREGNTSGFSLVSNPTGTQALMVDTGDLEDGIIESISAFTAASLPCIQNNETEAQSASITIVTGQKVRVHFDVIITGQVGTSWSSGTVIVRRDGFMLRDQYPWDIVETDGNRTKTVSATITDSPAPGTHEYTLNVAVPLGQRAVYASNRSIELEMKK